MTEAVACPRCRLPIPADAPLGSCPACLFRLGLAETPVSAARGTDPDPAQASTLTRAGDPNETLTATPGPSPGDGVLPELPDYEVIEEIGRGGSGIVFRARQAGTERLVALKFLLRGVGSASERARFRAEVRALGRLNHPNVVMVHDVGEADGCPYFAMEYMPGGNLARRSRPRSYSPLEAAALVETLARAVQAAHDAGVLHRDLKPGNILLSADGIPKIADFGLSKHWEVADDADTVERMTRTGEILGTPAFMAPELASAKHGAVGPRTDVYGLGAVLYELLTDRPPFKGRDTYDTLRQVVHTPVVPPRDRNRRVPKGLEAVCLRCLEKDPPRRYATPADLAEDLARFRRGDETEARPLSPAARLGRAVRRRARVLALAGCVAVAVTSAAAAWYYGRPVGGPEPEPDPEAILSQLGQELRDGKRLTLIGETGRPRGYRWQGGEGRFADSHFRDGTCCFETAGAVTLVLLPDVPDSGFQLSAEVRHEDNLDVGERGAVGVVFGLESVPWPGGPAQVWYSVTFDDRLAIDRPPKRPRAQWAHLRFNGVAVRAGRVLTPASRSLGNIEFTPPEWGAPAPWRRVVLDVRPSGIRFQWGAPDGTLVGVGQRPIDPPFLDEQGRQVLAAAAANVKELPAPWPGWFPRGAIGLYVMRGQASYRNVTIVP